MEDRPIYYVIGTILVAVELLAAAWGFSAGLL